MNELERIINLANLDLDYTVLENTFADLTKLAALIAGTSISLINLIDSYTQWSIANHGLPLQQMPRENSVCQYTLVAEQDHFKVSNLETDDRFKDQVYVKGDPNLRFYLGVPLQTEEGFNIGALCVLDTEARAISQEKIEMLKIIAREIVVRLKAIHQANQLKNELQEAKQLCYKVAHDVRGPLSGIVGVATIIKEKGEESTLQEVLKVVDMFQKSGQSVLELADEILNPFINYGKPEMANEKGVNDNAFNLPLFKQKLDQLYQPQALNKAIQLDISFNPEMAGVPIPKNKLLQILGNLIANAIKFTSPHGSVKVIMDVLEGEKERMLHLQVEDSGVGLDETTIDYILNNRAVTTLGTQGETGFGLGLPMIVGLIRSLQGSLQINSTPGIGTTFTIDLPLIQ